MPVRSEDFLSVQIRLSVIELMFSRRLLVATYCLVPSQSRLTASETKSLAVLSPTISSVWRDRVGRKPRQRYFRIVVSAWIAAFNRTSSMSGSLRALRSAESITRGVHPVIIAPQNEFFGKNFQKSPGVERRCLGRAQVWRSTFRNAIRQIRIMTKDNESKLTMDGRNGTPTNADFLRAAFATEQECLVPKLKSSRRIVHAGDRGEVNEQHFIEFLRKYLPNRYTVEKAIVLDSEGNVSQSIDVVVFDRQYTPTLLDNDKHRYVPAEAVYAVFECKPQI